MEETLQIVLQEYVKAVEEVCNILLKSINDSENLNLKNKFDFFAYRSKCQKMEFEAGGISYRLHGKGCTAFREGMFIDWDFGYRSRWCGIDPWKVSITLKRNNSPYAECFDGDFIRAACEQSVRRGIMFQKYDQYYFAATENETFKPEFPTEYDTLVIEYFDSIWSVPRNKVVDRFIRKSTRIHKQIYKSEDCFMLRFLLNGKDVYAIPYSDVCYPENAVKIMSDQIIREIKCA